MAQKFYLGPWQQDPTFPWVRWIPPPGASCVLDLRSLPAHATAGIALFSTEGTLGSDYTVPSSKALVASMLGVAGLSGTTLLDWMWDFLTLRADPAGLNSAPPLMPTGLTLVLHAGDTQRARPFTLNLPEAANVLAVMKEQYRDLRQRAQAGQLIGPDGPDPEFHRRVLDTWGEKFRVVNPEDFFIPAGMPKETRLPHRTMYSESFNKADAATLGPDLTWTEVVGTAWGVTSNKGQIQVNGADNHARAEHDISSSDHFAQDTVDISSGTTITAGGVMLRYSASADTAYMWTQFVNAAGDGEHAWAKWVAGAETYPLGTVATEDPANGNVLRGEVQGSSLRGYQNGTLIKTVTDTAITSGTRAGLRGVIVGTGGYYAVENFSYGDLFSPVHRPSYGMPQAVHRASYY